MRTPVAFLALLLALAAVLSGCTTPGSDGGGQGPPGVAGSDAELLAALRVLAQAPELRFETDHGTVRMVLYDTWLPQTTAHIAALAESGFYDGTLVHRVVDDFVIQGGDPSGTGQLGSGETVPLERDARLDFAAGGVGLARDVDEDSGDSQWFIAETPQPHLTDPTGATGDVFGAYALFGQVFEGMDVVRAIAAEPTLPGADRPVQDVVLEQAEVLPPPVDVDLLDLVRAIHPGADLWLGTGTLDTPLWMVVGHPVHLLVHDEADTGESFQPNPGGFGGPDDGFVEATWTETTDPGTWETTVTFPAPGAWTFRANDVCRDETCGIVVDVLPWHDDYADFVAPP